jgi:hypothetical protein
MEKDTVLNLIINGFHEDFPFESKINRVTLLETFGTLEGINKKNGVFEILKKHSILFYVGYGTIGFLNGIRICDLLKFKISNSQIEEILKEHKINYTSNPNSKIYILGNVVKIFFTTLEEEKDELFYVSEVIRCQNLNIEKRLMQANSTTKDL